MIRRKLRGQHERGVVAVLVAVVLGAGVLMGAAALVVDVGNMYAEHGQLQNGADAAALAVAGACASEGCRDAAAQVRTAQKYANANARDGHTKVTLVCGSWDALSACPPPTGGLSDCIGDLPTGNYVEVRVRTELADGSTVLPPTFAAAMAGSSSYRGTSIATCARSTGASVCVPAEDMTFEHTFNGPAGRATITALKPLCPGERETVTLVSYTMPEHGMGFPQHVYDSDVQMITSGKMSLSLSVTVPACDTQVDMVFIDGPINPLVSAKYLERKVGSPGKPGNRSAGVAAWYNSGINAPSCTQQPSTTLTPACDGTLAVQLKNAAGANVDGVFTITTDAGDTWVHVPPGGSKTVTVPAANSSKVAVLDNLGQKTKESWQRPATC
jgi:Flp pilus assembly protein TadG